MNNDLISREALKKAINDNGCRHSHYFDIFDVIDNAPTVDINTELSVAYLKGRRQGQSEERQTGEWKVNLTTGDIFCSRCKKVRRDTRKEHIYYCNHCGARMLRASEVIT